MPTISVNSDAGIIRPVHAQQTVTARITVLDPTGAAKNIAGYAFRASIRVSPKGRIVKIYNTSGGGGVTLQSAPSGRIEVAVVAGDIPVTYPHAVLEVAEYSGGVLTGAITDRFRFHLPVLGGSDLSY